MILGVSPNGPQMLVWIADQIVIPAIDSLVHHNRTSDFLVSLLSFMAAFLPHNHASRDLREQVRRRFFFYKKKYVLFSALTDAARRIFSGCEIAWY